MESTSSSWQKRDFFDPHPFFHQQHFFHHPPPPHPIREITTYHNRDGSVSSLGSFNSSEAEAMVDRSLPPPRGRLGTDMAILASSSPEIKALKLPLTPSFPKGFFQHRQSSTSSYISSSSSSASTNYVGQCKNDLSVFLEAVDGSDKTRKSNSRGSSFDQEDSLVRSLRSMGLEAAPKVHRKRLPRSGKENNTVPFFLLEDARSAKNEVRPPKPRLLRNARHRRVSCDSLPSPAEIACPPPSYYSTERSSRSRRRNRFAKQG